ncbi:HWE histidine kinase domain-containing protein [Erythrobacter donghaensis]|uniref:HWE histidine kinase domain-containing protein n=1 Tax=Erythrobacter donghaensis TaxID=267135 RepID=UPI000A3A6583|nr:HWE histidine kinase domain-containing protein [Erythrobacter donghaensis]
MNHTDVSLVAPKPNIREALAIMAKSTHIVGDDYFPSLVESLASSLHVRWAFVCQFNPVVPNEATTIAFWDNGPAENFVYNLLNTPCADVASQGTCCYADDIVSLYPFDQMLADLGARSYAGTALKSLDGRVVGLLAVMDEKPLGPPEAVTQIIGLFSGRAAAELERIATASLNERLGKIVEASVSEAYVFAGDTCRFELVNRGARENLGYTMDELHQLTPWDIKPEFSKEQFEDLVKPLKSGKVDFLRFETVHARKDGTTYPVSVQLQYFPNNGRVFFASITDDTERKAKEAQERLILAEMDHRCKNILTIVQILAQQTADSSPEEFISTLKARLSGLSASHDILVKNAWNDLPFKEIIFSQLGHFKDIIGSRIIISGPPIKIKAKAAQNFGMALHELATNASKYGALSSEDGCINVKWEEITTERGLCLHMSWIESGGPPVVAPSRSGFGSFMIRDSLAFQFNCDVNMDYHPTGFRCSFVVPAEMIY